MSKAIRQLALPLETHRNHYLFSDHYLNEVLPRQPVWREAEAEAQEALQEITALHEQKAGALPHYSEGAVEQEWVRPILDILGHVYHVQPSLTDALGTPDYAFFTDEPTKQAASPTWGTSAFWDVALAVGDAKRWDRPLDKRLVNGVPDAFTNANPCYQIDYYLRRTGCTWGMVTNGRLWRLYHRDSSFRLDVFYEVDLVQLIEQGNAGRRGLVDAFRYFYLFFRAAAFRPDAEGRCWLDEVLGQSAAYAVHVGDELKGRVYEALRLLAQGFLDYPGDDSEQVLDPTTDLPRVHDACLILLYRLLFLLYAECRGLLPMGNPSYAGQYSLKAIKEDIAHKLGAGVIYLAKRATIWDDLRTLFDIIYGGQEALGVPAYDGRLFEPDRYPFLEEHTIGDKYLAQAIDLLARAEAGPGQGLSFVDYRDLSIRHLGSIYEGLLEYRLAYAAEEMAVLRRGRKEEIVPLSEADRGKVTERIPAGQVYLVTDRGERKATGSYYTPDYIVKYIVEQTLGPLADTQAKAVEKEISALKARHKGGARRTREYKDELVRLQNSFADHILALNCLDPAMGSGHFLVEATDYLARRIVEAGVEAEALSNGDEESELSYWRRRVVERCIYGVDLNLLAVELAKLSLWLATVARGKPLSFLDHHLRCGNSLIGARVADLQALPVRKKRRKEEAEARQLAMWDESTFTQDMFRVVGAMRQIQEYETADLVSVKEKERLFDETVERERRKWRTIADLWTATYFGLELTPELYNACVQYVQDKPVLLQAAQAEAVLVQAHEMWEEKRFFHWEIEFPEVFFDEYGQHRGDAAGFDAVVGNPPWGASLTRSEKSWFNQKFTSTAGNNDTFAAFIEGAIDNLRSSGQMGMIVPDAWLTGISYEPLRRTVYDRTTLETFVNLPYDVFETAYVDSVIVTASRALPRTQADGRRRVRVLNYGKRGRIQTIDEDDARWMAIEHTRWRSDPRLRFDVSRSDAEFLLCQKVREQGTELQKIADTARGLEAYSRLTQNKDIVDSRAYHSEVSVGPEWYPQFQGTLRRYTLEFGEPIYVKLGEHLAECPEERFFNTPRILLRRLISRQFRLMAVYTEERFANDSSTFNILVVHPQYSPFYLLGLVNTRLFSYYVLTGSMIAQRDDYPKLSLAEVRSWPIYPIAFITPTDRRRRYADEGQRLHNQFCIKNNYIGTCDFAFHHLEEGRSDVVHDLVAHLAKQMIAMHKAKLAEVRGFLDWLAEYTGLPVDDWALKTNLQSYYEHDWDEMHRILKRNQRKLHKVGLDMDAYKNEPAARVRAAWETSMETLRPLLARIEATDQLIDQIVYQLYGLTEEEIAVVEGR